MKNISWIQKGLVLRGDLLLVEAMERRLPKEQAAKSKTWANMQVIRDLAAMATSCEDWEVVGLAAVSCGLLLRASEAASIYLDGETAVWDRANSRRGQCTSSVGLWTLEWLCFLGIWRAAYGHRPDRPTVGSTSPPLFWTANPHRA